MALALQQYRKEIRTLLRDDSYPTGDIDSAIERVLGDINSMGRFPFHEAIYTLVISANNYVYAVPGNVQAEHVFVYALGTPYEAEVLKRREPWTDGIPVTSSNTGDVPSAWFSYANNWYIQPAPNATMVSHGNISVFYDKDLTMPTSPVGNLGIPDRHRNVIIYGAAAQLRPGLILASPDGEAIVESLYQRAVENMKTQENWRFNNIPTLRNGRRWNNASTWGHVGRMR
jgi:hypothetical protein